MSPETSMPKKTRIITLEEHFATPAFVDGPGGKMKMRSHTPELIEKICDLADIRIADMDAAGIDVQVLTLTSPGVNNLEAADAVTLARDTNDRLAEAVNRYPGRFYGFATLPTAVPETAADELERTVREYGFKGGLINGHTRGRYLDDEFFWPILERAEALNVPLQIHPATPPKAVVEASFTGNFSAAVTSQFANAGWGWHIETAVHVLRLILSGALDRYPRLQLLIGHLSEGLSFMMPRIDNALPMTLTKLERPVGSYLRENVHYSFSGFNFMPTFLNLLLEVGVPRIVFSADYPYQSMADARTFLDNLPVSPGDKEKIAHENAESLLGI